MMVMLGLQKLPQVTLADCHFIRKFSDFELHKQVLFWMIQTTNRACRLWLELLALVLVSVLMSVENMSECRNPSLLSVPLACRISRFNSSSFAKLLVKRICKFRQIWSNIRRNSFRKEKSRNSNVDFNLSLWLQLEAENTPTFLPFLQKLSAYLRITLPMHGEVVLENGCLGGPLLLTDEALPGLQIQVLFTDVCLNMRR